MYCYYYYYYCHIQGWIVAVLSRSVAAELDAVNQSCIVMATFLVSKAQNIHTLTLMCTMFLRVVQVLREMTATSTVVLFCWLGGGCLFVYLGFFFIEGLYLKDPSAVNKL